MSGLTTKDYDYDLPEDRIAQVPAAQRDHSKLLVVDRQTGVLEDRRFYEIKDYLHPGDLLVMNDTRVLPARIFGKRETGGTVELLLLKRLDERCWETMVKPGKKAKPGVVLTFGDGLLKGEIMETVEGGLRVIRFEYDGVFEEILSQIGSMPLPPYIHEKLEDQSRYQTVYAAHDGSAAAPTAGLHFTPELLDEIQQMGVGIAKVTLHVGIGTFRPVKTDCILDHHMHAEWYELSEETARCMNETKAAGGRIIAVGTTSVRTLESVATNNAGQIVPESGTTEIFIYPGYEWKVVDVLITNFHLPESTLLMLVSSFYDREKILAAYAHAIESDYRFFSFGDAMLLL